MKNRMKPVFNLIPSTVLGKFCHLPKHRRFRYQHLEKYWASGYKFLLPVWVRKISNSTNKYIKCLLELRRVCLYLCNWYLEKFRVCSMYRPFTDDKIKFSVFFSCICRGSVEIRHTVLPLSQLSARTQCNLISRCTNNVIIKDTNLIY